MRINVLGMNEGQGSGFESPAEAACSDSNLDNGCLKFKESLKFASEVAEVTLFCRLHPTRTCS